MPNRYFVIGLLLMFSAYCQSQESVKIVNGKITVSGKIQTDILIPQADPAINTGDYNSKILSNTFGDLILAGKYIGAGLRFEMFKKPMPGFGSEYEGAGIPFFYFSGRTKHLQLTLGNYYEQFGSGLAFRTYEERSLGLDNSLRGGLLVFRNKGLNLKALVGQQRYYWDYTKGIVYGTDAELNLEDWIDHLKRVNARFQWGASFVGKYQQKEDIMVSLTEKLNLPEKVGAFATRIRYQKGKMILMSEYAVKANDPSADNNFIYKNGSALLLSGSYSQKGFGLLMQVKRSDNMTFRSRRTEPGRMLFINHLPAFTKQHAYALAAMYPYATQSDGEWAFQEELTYMFNKKTPLGGKYGTGLKLNFSRVNSIDKEFLNGASGPVKGTDGYRSDFFKIGNELYYQDFDVEISKKLSKSFSLNVMYMNQGYNQEVIEGHANNGRIVHSDIFVLEGKNKIGSQTVLRAEFQFLQTKQDYGNWIFGLLELSVRSSWMFTLSDMVNTGVTDLHYYMTSAVYSHNAHRLQLSYGRTRAGFNCSGGVCRFVPATHGFQLSYFMSF
jgi:hypothetical protein